MDKKSPLTARLPVGHPREEQTSPGDDRRTALSAGLIVLIALLTYMPAVRGGFVWDDSLIIHNRMIADGGGLYRFWFTTQAPDYYPLTWSLWWLEWRLWGSNAMGYHVVNVLLHAANAILVGVILRRLKIPGAWLAALVFAVHPVNVATAAWISEQKNTLSMLFFLGAILLYLKFDERHRWLWYGLSFASFLLALLSKSAVVMLPVVLLGCLWWRRGRVCAKDLVAIVPFFVLALVLGLVTVWFQHNRVLGDHAVRTDSFLARLLAAGWVPWFYLSKDLWPFDLCAVYPKWVIDPSRLTSYLPGFAVVFALAFFWWKRDSWGRPLLFGLGYFVVTLFPVMGFFEQGFYGVSLVADHWQYGPMIGVVALAVGCAASLCRRWGRQGECAGVLASVVMLGVLGTAARARSAVYADPQTLWQDTLEKNPGAWLAHNNLGYLLAGRGDFAGAARHYEEALRLNPHYAAAHNNLGTVLLRTGKVQEAIGHFTQAVEIEPDWAAAHNNLGSARLQAGDTANAIKEFEQAVRYDPDYAEAYYNLGNALMKEDRTQEAIQHYERATVINPDFAQAQNNLGLLLQADNPSEAVAHYERALRAKPDYVDAHYNLGNALAQLHQMPEAIRHYERVLQLRPDHLDARYNLGILLANQGRYSEAIELFQVGLASEPDSQRFRKAIDDARQAELGR